MKVPLQTFPGHFVNLHVRGRVAISSLFPIFEVAKSKTQLLTTINLEELKEKLDMYQLKPQEDFVTDKVLYRSFYLAPRYESLRILPYNKVVLEDSPFNSFRGVKVVFEARINLFGFCATRLLFDFADRTVTIEDLIDFIRELYVQEERLAFKINGSDLLRANFETFAEKTMNRIFEKHNVSFLVDRNKVQSEPIYIIEEVIGEDSTGFDLYEKFKHTFAALCLKLEKKNRESLDVKRTYFSKSIIEYGYSTSDLVLLSWPSILLLGEGRVSVDDYLRTIELARIFWVALKYLDNEVLDPMLHEGNAVIQRRRSLSTRAFEHYLNKLGDLRYHILRLIDFFNPSKRLGNVYLMRLNEALLQIYNVPELHGIVNSKLNELERISERVRDRISERNNWIIQMLLLALTGVGLLLVVKLR